MCACVQEGERKEREKREREKRKREERERLTAHSSMPGMCSTSPIIRSLPYTSAAAAAVDDDDDDDDDDDESKVDAAS